VHVFNDFGEKETPDSVFPNNWFSTHNGGHVAIYPMYSPSRRRERRSDVIEMLKSEYRVQDVVDFFCLEWDDLFLEGTGRWCWIILIVLPIPLNQTVQMKLY